MFSGVSKSPGGFPREKGVFAEEGVERGTGAVLSLRQWGGSPAVRWVLCGWSSGRSDKHTFPRRVKRIHSEV